MLADIALWHYPAGITDVFDAVFCKENNIISLYYTIWACYIILYNSRSLYLHCTTHAICKSYMNVKRHKFAFIDTIFL